MADNFLKQQATTQRFTLGAPRNVTLNKAGDMVFFIRSQGSIDARGCLWRVRLEGDCREELLVDAQTLQVTSAVLPAAERARRERARESAAGITSFSIDDSGERAVFSLGGDLYTWTAQGVYCLLSGQSIYDPRLSPDGQQVAFVRNGDMCVVSTAQPQAGVGPEVTVLAHHDDPDVTWGLADFIAAEEMDRLRGFWWAPDSQQLIAEQVDNRPVAEWYIADPAQPGQEPVKIRYPAAGTANAVVKLAIFALNGTQTDVHWPAAEYEYLASVNWHDSGLCIEVQSRNQQVVQLREVAADGSTDVVATTTDEEWVELLAEPLVLPDGTIIRMVDEAGQRIIKAGDQVVSTDRLIPRSLCGALDDGTYFFSAYQDDPKVWRIYQVAQGLVTPITEPAVSEARARGKSLIVFTQSLTQTPQVKILQRSGKEWQVIVTLASHAAVPEVVPRPKFMVSQERQLHSALLLPEGYKGDHPLPVILHPYGGPHAQCVLGAQRAYYTDQWWANQGFAVVITDGRGTPGRGPAWEKAIAGNLIDVVLEDQITALREVAAQHGQLDLTRVGIRGWSFGGYLAAYAVVRHPEVFYAAVAGAPVTDWRLYDTHYTERYLGHPDQNAANYDACSLLNEAEKLARPLLIIHGLADDNVVAAHTLQFSNALLAAGRPHAVLPLSGATHMASGAVLAENLERLQLEFFCKELQVPIPTSR